MRKTAALAVLMTVAACQAPPAEMTEAEIAEIEAEVMGWAEAWLDGWEADTRTGCETNLALIHPEPVVFLTGGEPQRKADWFEYCLSMNAGLAGFSGEWIEKEVRVLSPDAAVFLGRYDGTFEEESGRILRYPGAVQLILVERMADGWGLTLTEWSNGPSEVVEEG
jgi:hypothetical protein